MRRSAVPLQRAGLDPNEHAMRTRSVRLRRWSALAVGALVLLGAVAPVGTAAPAAAADDEATSQPEPSVDVCEGAAAGAFRDVPASNLHAANIDCVAAHRIVVGVGGGNYAPGVSVKRAQMASFLVNLVEVAGDERHEVPAVNPFADVLGNIHANNVAIAAHLRIARGVTPTTYAPSRDVTRAQMASFVAQAIEAAGGQLPASAPNAFNDDEGSVHERNIDRLAAAGIVSGVGGGRYNPSGTVSRAQMATFLANAARHLQGQARWSAPPIGTGDEDADDTEAELALALSQVLRATSASDLLELRWNQAVTPAGSATGVRVLGADGVTPVANGTSMTAHGEAAVRVGLDAGLQGDATYWLTVPAGLVTDAADRTSTAQTVAFVFSDTGNGSTSALPVVSDVAVGGEAVAAGGLVTTQSSTPVVTGSAAAAGTTIAAVEYRVEGGSWANATAVDGDFDGSSESFTAELGPLGVATHAVELRARAANGLTSAIYAFDVTVGPLVPEVVSVVTDPAEDRLVVRFNTEVVCPNTPNGAASWSFTNASSDGGQQGLPDSVSAPADNGTVCYLNYEGDGIMSGDSGSLAFNDRGYADAYVLSSTGERLRPFGAVPVAAAD